MALDLFKRVETRKGLFAVEKITLIYNLLTSILVLFLFRKWIIRCRCLQTVLSLRV